MFFPKVSEVLTRYPHYDLLIIGYSLGAGTLVMWWSSWEILLATVSSSSQAGKWWSRQRANDRYKDHLDGQLTVSGLAQLVALKLEKERLLPSRTEVTVIGSWSIIVPWDKFERTEQGNLHFCKYGVWKVSGENVNPRKVWERIFQVTEVLLCLPPPLGGRCQCWPMSFLFRTLRTVFLGPVWGTFKLW